MEERLLFYRVYMHGAGLGIGGTLDPGAGIFPYPAIPCFPDTQFTTLGADRTPDSIFHPGY